MGERFYPSEPFDEETRHRQLVWNEFLAQSVEAANRAIEWLELADIDPESASESDIEDNYRERWASTGDIVIAVLNFLWPEIESLAIKLGVPFQPEISEIDGDEDEL